MKFLNWNAAVGVAGVARVPREIIFVYHGYPKLVHANAGNGEFFVMHGLPGYLVPVAGILEGFGEFVCWCWDCSRGRVALLLAIEMGVAIWKVHSGTDTWR